jgi:hypothetical protein
MELGENRKKRRGRKKIYEIRIREMGVEPVARGSESSPFSFPAKTDNSPLHQPTLHHHTPRESPRDTLN